MNREEKQTVVKELNETFKDHDNVLLIHFTGVSVADSIELRRKISEVECGYRVVKNRLALRALEDTSLKGLEEHFKGGPTAIAYTGDNPVALAKVLKTFFKDHPGMSFKAGVIEGQSVSVGEITTLADMPSREELLTKLLYLLKAPLNQLAIALQSPVRNLASILQQLGETKEKEQPQLTEPVEAVAEQEEVQEEAVAEQEEVQEEAAAEQEEVQEEAAAEQEEVQEEAVAEQEETN